MSSLGHGDNYGRVTFHPEEDQVTLQRRLMRSQREIMSELSSVMSHRVGEQKMRENEAIERKYGSEAVHDMGWDVTAAAFRGSFSTSIWWYISIGQFRFWCINTTVSTFFPTQVANNCAHNSGTYIFISILLLPHNIVFLSCLLVAIPV